MCAEHSENINRKWPRNNYFWAFRLSAVSVPQSHLSALRFLDDLGFERLGIRATLAHGNPSDKGASGLGKQLVFRRYIPIVDQPSPAFCDI
jgi:hypothetical protein